DLPAPSGPGRMERAGPRLHGPGGVADDLELELLLVLGALAGLVAHDLRMGGAGVDHVRSGSELPRFERHAVAAALVALAGLVEDLFGMELADVDRPLPLVGLLLFLLLLGLGRRALQHEIHRALLALAGEVRPDL